MELFEDLYQQFLNIFPQFLRPIISVALALFIVYSVFQVLKKNFIFLIVLVVLLPASVPILSNVAEIIVNILKYLFVRG